MNEEAIIVLQEITAAIDRCAIALEAITAELTIARIEKGVKND